VRKINNNGNLQLNKVTVVPKASPSPLKQQTPPPPKKKHPKRDIEYYYYSSSLSSTDEEDKKKKPLKSPSPQTLKQRNALEAKIGQLQTEVGGLEGLLFMMRSSGPAFSKSEKDQLVELIREKKETLEEAEADFLMISSDLESRIAHLQHVIEVRKCSLENAEKLLSVLTCHPTLYSEYSAKQQRLFEELTLLLDQLAHEKRKKVY
jgi:chaperonin cofactor prefoldin